MRTTLLGEYSGISSVVLKKKSNRDKCFAFVNFDSQEVANRVLQEMNYTKLDGFPIRISRSDPETRTILRSIVGNLFVKGLDESIEASQLHEAFSNFGDVISCKIPMSNKNGIWVSNGYGFVQFRNPDDAKRALRDLQDASINDKKIMIQECVKMPKKSSEETYTNIYAKDFDPQKYPNEEAIRPIFEEYGNITSIKMMQSKPDILGFSQPLPFVYCNFQNHDSAKNAAENLNGKVEEGKMWSCGRMMSKYERQQYLIREGAKVANDNYERTKGRNLYIRNFDENVEDEQLKEFFSQFGEVESAIIMRDRETKASKKFGFVCFTTKESAERAIAGTTEIEFQGKLLYVNLIQRKIDRMNNNNANHAAKPRSTPKINETFDQLPKKAQESQVVTPLAQENDILRKELETKGFDEKRIRDLLKNISYDQIKRIVNDPNTHARYMAYIMNHQ